MTSRLIPLFLLPLLLTGCAGNGYISSTIHTVLGLDVSENPKTQVPHVRFGYVRSGLYYVPTGKSPGPDGSRGTGESVTETPELVSEVFVNAKFLDSVTINEKFAIGKTAVASGAAERAFASTAAQQVAQTSREVGTNTIQHVDGPVMKEVNHTTERIIKEPPPASSLDAETLIKQMNANLKEKGATPDQQVAFKTRAGELKQRIEEEQDATKKAGLLKDMSDLVEKAKTPSTSP